MNDKGGEIAPQAVVRDFKQFVVLAFMILQGLSLLVILLSHLVQTDVITDEIYSVLFQRVLLLLLELIRLLFI